MKKILIAMILFSMLFFGAACGGSSKNKDEQPDTDEISEDQDTEENDGENEMLLLGIMGNRPANRMVLQINEEIVSLPLHSQDSNTSWFRLSIEQLLQICTANNVDLDTDLETDGSSQYYELSTFASRFYNVVFNRLKFLYSVNIRLITDQ